MALDGLYVPTRAGWYAAFQQELLTFPMGKHDDQVDALGLIGQLLATISPGKRPEKKKAEVDSGYKPFTDDLELRTWLSNEDVPPSWLDDSIPSFKAI
jgi:hypothetical protein